VNISPEEALIVKVDPAVQNLVSAPANFYTNPKESFPQARESPQPLFGTHLKEAAEIMKDWWKDR
jgi:hypothetical protein